MFTTSFDATYTFDQTMTWSAVPVGACSVAYYKITCTDPNNAVYKHQNSGVTRDDSQLCDKFTYVTSAVGAKIQIQEAVMSLGTVSD